LTLDKVNQTISIINNKTVPIVFVLFLTFLLMFSGRLEVTSGTILTSLNNSSSFNSTAAVAPPPLPPELTSTQIYSSTNGTCSLTPSLIEIEGTPQQMEGPYFVDGMPNRSDIRTDPSDGSMQQGIPLDLLIHVYVVDKKSGSCTPLSGAQVDIWHANSQGVYSSVNSQGTEGKKFLRGFQVTDDNGTVRFTTVYPGWYQGRAIHIHDKVRLFNGSDKVVDWTSQLYFNDSINELVHKQSPYSEHGLPDTTNEEDIIYTGPSTDHLVQSNAGKHLMLNLTREGGGGQPYLGTFNIILNSTQHEP
jgi:protocatechuate 3,4-dioxygenase beta subunit